MAQQIITDKHLIRIFLTIFGSLVVDSKQYPVLSLFLLKKKSKYSNVLLCTDSSFSVDAS